LPICLTRWTAVMYAEYRRLRLLAAVALPAIAGALALGATQPPLLVNADRSTAIELSGDRAQATYEGRVVITRGAVVIHGERGVVYVYKQHLDKTVVTGTPATFTWRPRQGSPVNGHAATITYLAASDTVVLTGDVEVTRGAETFSAAEARYALKTGTLAAHGGSGPTPGRVHVVVPPPAATAGRP
ncbi:MAG: lipopolysaccharide transport periplasmic protein LptA, partial [Acetobacteraceae bacterium]